jgi:DNA-binding response OmpR family regulator
MNKENKLRILLVDDDETYAKVVSLGLEEEFGFEVVWAPGGQEAIDLLKSGDRAFSVIVLDYRMPRVTGIDVLRWMQRHEITIPAFILTAAGSESVVAEAIKLDAYDYFRKEDTDIERLAAHIRATHNLHLERLARALEEEHSRGKLKGDAETARVNNLVSAMTPTLNSAFANVASDLDADEEALFAGVPEAEREELKKLFRVMQREFGKLHTAVRGLLSLYAMIALHHAEGNVSGHIPDDAKKEPDASSQAQ